MTFTRCLDPRWSGVVTALVLGGCGGSSPRRSAEPQTTAAKSSSVSSSPGELLSVPAVGRIYGRCRPGDRRWTIKFVPAPRTATDSVTYRIGSARSHNLDAVNDTITWRLVPDQFKSHEPADPVSRFPATSIKTTAPVSLDIRQGSEPHIFVVHIRFAVAAAIGDTNDCALISTSLNATTYYPTSSAPPPYPSTKS